MSGDTLTKEIHMFCEEVDVIMEYAAKTQEGKLSSTFPQISIRIYNYHKSKMHLLLFTHFVKFTEER